MTDKISEAKKLIELGYSTRTIELIQNQVNVEAMQNPDADAVFQGPSGDLIRLYIKINNAIIEDAKFLCYGCLGSSAAMSALTILIKGKPLSEVKKTTEEDIVNALGGLPETMLDSAKFSIETLKKTIANYEKTKEL